MLKLLDVTGVQLVRSKFAEGCNDREEAAAAASVAAAIIITAGKKTFWVGGNFMIEIEKGSE
jgi:hypothetical protein